MQKEYCQSNFKHKTNTSSDEHQLHSSRSKNGFYIVNETSSGIDFNISNKNIKIMDPKPIKKWRSVVTKLLKAIFHEFVQMAIIYHIQKFIRILLDVDLIFNQLHMVVNRPIQNFK